MYETYKRAYNAGLVGYLVMFVLAVVFYKERITFCDASFYLFELLVKNSFTIQHMRFGMVYTQILPLLASRAGMLLSSVMLLYSVNYMLAYFVCYVICGSVLKRYDFALLLLLFNILFVSDSFYWPQTELPQGISLMIVCFALIGSDRKMVLHKFSLLLLGLGIITVVFFHPLIIFPFYFIVLFMLNWKISEAQRKVLYGASILFLLTVVVQKLAFTDKYEMHAMSGVKNFRVLFPDYLHLYSNSVFLDACKGKYIWVPVVALANTVVYTRAKQWSKLLLFLCGTGAFLLLVNITRNTAETPFFYIEGLWLPLAIFLGLPFVFDVLPVLQEKKLAVAVISLIVVTGCVRIYAVSKPYVTRLNWERNYLNIHHDKKLAVYETCVPLDTLMLTWATPYEFWLLSTTERQKTASIIVIDNIPQYAWAFDQTRSLIVSGDIFPYAVLPKRYFHLTDTTTGYILIKK